MGAFVLLQNGIRPELLRDEVGECELIAPGELEQKLTGGCASVLVIGPSAEDPLSIAQRVAELDQAISVVVVADSERAEALQGEMIFRPHMARDLVFVTEAELTDRIGLVRAASLRAQARRRHIRALAAIPREVPRWTPRPETTLGHLLRTAPVGVVFLLPDGVVSSWNPEMARLTGVGADEIVGRPVRTLAERDGVRELARFLASVPEQEAASTGPLGDLNVRIELREQDELILEARLSRVHEGPGWQGFMVLFLDVTERVQAERERRRFEGARRLEELGLVAGGIAHDFNNLLVGILGNVELALDRAPGDELLQSCLLDARMSSLEAKELTSQMLAYSGKGSFEPQRTSLNGAIRAMSRLLKSAVSSNIAIVLDLVEGDALPVTIDVVQWRRVLLNLVRNASEAMGGRPGEVVLRTRRERIASPRRARFTDMLLEAGEYAVVEVADSGSGIAEPLVERIFDPFYTSKPSGHGLGLAAVLGIARHHGGEVDLWSSPAEGTTFVLRIPLAGPSSTLVEAAGVPGRGRSGKALTILVVDDEEGVRKVTDRALRLAGHRVLLASTAEEAFALLASDEDVDVILLDYRLRESSGREMLEEMLARGLRQPVVLCSGFTEGDVGSPSEFPNLRAFLSKPFTIDELHAAVAAAVGT